MQALCILLLACISQGQLDPQREAMDLGAKQCLKATVDGDFRTLADLTHPDVVKRIGGKEQMIELVSKGMGEMAKKGTKFASGQTETPSKLVKGADGLYGVIPTTLVLDTPVALLTVKSFLIGYSGDDGKTWVYIDGANGADAIRREFKQVPEALVLPEKAQPKIDLKQGSAKPE